MRAPLECCRCSRCRRRCYCRRCRRFSWCRCRCRGSGSPGSLCSSDGNLHGRSPLLPLVQTEPCHRANCSPSPKLSHRLSCRPERPMRAQPPPPPRTTSLLFLYLLVLSAVCHHVAASDAKDTTHTEKNDLFSGDHSPDGLELSTVSEISSTSEISSGTEYDYYEEYEEDPQLSGYVLDDSIKVERLVKPKKNRTESEKNTSKTGRKKFKNRKRKQKKINPCDGEYKNYCIHGECKYIESLEAVTCKCHQDFFGERCGEQSMKTHSLGDVGNPFTVLAIVAAILSVLCFSAIVLITKQIWKAHYSIRDQGIEERKHLKRENKNGIIGV
ncbi:amphiregulin [Antechinus flavipes]|uniref:amphiregulin n=1 Tax=Antechinus flavipes TaxID=38775 RepID=UPI0022364877|nr:amphiregulin [Antechinus flavipes]